MSIFEEFGAFKGLAMQFHSQSSHENNHDNRPSKEHRESFELMKQTNRGEGRTHLLLLCLTDGVEELNYSYVCNLELHRNEAHGFD